MINLEVYFLELHKQSGRIMENSLAGQNAAAMGKGFQFASELTTWQQTIILRYEAELLRFASLEYTFALLALTQGHYRHAFKSLRLVMELSLQTVALSSNELCLREWLDNRRDTIWSTIIDDEEGIFSKRFTLCFFPSLERHVQHYRELARSIYRECSECVHGNIPKYVDLPSTLTFVQKVFDLWHSKAEIVAMIAHFAFCLRYFRELGDAQRSNLELVLSERLGHIPEIREALGGPV